MSSTLASTWQRLRQQYTMLPEDDIDVNDGRRLPRDGNSSDNHGRHKHKPVLHRDHYAGALVFNIAAFILPIRKPSGEAPR